MQPLLLLHGAIGAADQLQPLASSLNKDYKVHAIDFSGHGLSAAIDDPFSISLFAQDVLRCMAENRLEYASVFGYSMGGYVAMYLAKHFPAKITQVATLATKFHWDQTIAANEMKMLDPEKLETKVPAFARALQQRHPGKDWKDILHKTASMLTSLGADNALALDDYKTVDKECLVMLGDRDKMVSLDETLDVYRTLPNAQMALLPGTGHPIEQVNTGLLSFLLRNFIR